jgi:hypothetical protein
MSALPQSYNGITWRFIEEALSQSDGLKFNAMAEEIQRHPSWLGRVSGLRAEKMLYEKADRVPYQYVLRQGEGDMDYYVTFVRPDLSVHHQPFIVQSTTEGCYCLNHGTRGPFIHTSIEAIVPLIIHCEDVEQCKPLIGR